MRGAGGWVSGYIVPVMSGELDGAITVGGETIDLAGGTGYHDHNWGFWEGVRGSGARSRAMAVVRLRPRLSARRCRRRERACPAS